MLPLPSSLQSSLPALEEPGGDADDNFCCTWVMNDDDEAIDCGGCGCAKHFPVEESDGTAMLMETRGSSGRTQETRGEQCGSNRGEYSCRDNPCMYRQMPLSLSIP